MVSLRIFLLILVTLLCREAASPVAGLRLTSAAVAMIGIVIGFGLLIKVAAVAIWNGSHHQSSWQAAASFERWRLRCENVWIASLPLLLFGSGWAQSLTLLEEAGVARAVCILGWIAPSFLFLMLSELTAAQVDNLAAEVQPRDSRASQHWSADWLVRIRLGQTTSLLVGVAPLAMVFVGLDVAQWSLVGRAEIAATIGAVCLTSLATLCLLPWGLSVWMGARPLASGELSQRIEQFCERLHLRGIQPMILRSGGRWNGAAIVGWLPPHRKLWLGDGLLERLSERQVEMVVLHELAHVDRRHTLWRVLPVLWAAGAMLGIWLLWPQGEAAAFRGLAMAFAANVILLVGIWLTAHACEVDADRAACLLAARLCSWTESRPQIAAVEMSSALTELLEETPSAARATWLHPSLAQRLERLSTSFGTTPSSDSARCAAPTRF